jgi:hypothetical protein
MLFSGLNITRYERNTDTKEPNAYSFVVLSLIVVGAPLPVLRASTMGSTRPFVVAISSKSEISNEPVAIPLLVCMFIDSPDIVYVIW